MDKNKPPRVLRDGNLKASIWANQGEKGVYFTVTPAKTYTDRQGTVRDTSSFSSAEMLRMAELCRKAYHVANELRAEHKRNFNPMASGQIHQPENTVPPQAQLPYQQTGQNAAPTGQNENPSQPDGQFVSNTPTTP